MDPVDDLQDRLLRFEEIVAIYIVQEEVFPAVAPAHYRVDGAGMLDSRFSRHAPISPRWADRCKHIYAPSNGP